MAEERRFTQEVYDALREGVLDPDAWYDPIIDWFSDRRKNIGNFFDEIELGDDMENMEEYFSYISDVHNYGYEKIRDIFLHVSETDQTYAGLLAENKKNLDSFVNLIDGLADAIAKPNFSTSFSASDFSKKYAEDVAIAVGSQWEEILKKDADKITDEEYLAIAQYAAISGNEELLENILNACFTENTDKGQNTNLYDRIVKVVTYDANGKLNKLADAFYAIQGLYANEVANGNTNIDSEAYARAIQMYEIANALRDVDSVSEAFESGRGGTKEYDRAINIEYDPITKKWQVKCIPNLGPGPYSDASSVIGKERTYNFSEVLTGEDAADLAREKSYEYLGVGDQSSFEEAMGTLGSNVRDEAIGKATEDVIESIPGLGTAITITEGAQDVISAADEASKNNAAVKVGDISTMANAFELTIASQDVNGEVSTQKYSIFASGETYSRIDAFNKYMKKHSDIAKQIGTGDLPNGKLTYSYIVQHPERVEKMLEDLREIKGTATKSSYDEVFGD